MRSEHHITGAEVGYTIISLKCTFTFFNIPTNISSMMRAFKKNKKHHLYKPRFFFLFVCLFANDSALFVNCVSHLRTNMNNYRYIFTSYGTLSLYLELFRNGNDTDIYEAHSCGFGCCYILVFWCEHYLEHYRWAIYLLYSPDI